MCGLSSRVQDLHYANRDEKCRKAALRYSCVGTHTNLHAGRFYHRAFLAATEAVPNAYRCL